MHVIRTCWRAAISALQWRLLALWTVALLLPTLVLALPFWQHFSASFDYSVHAADLAQRLDLSNIADLRSDPGRNPLAMQLGVFTALAITLLLSPLLAGAIATAARFGGTPTVRALLAGAAGDYPRMLRMLLWAALPLGAAWGISEGLQQLAASGADSAIAPGDGALWRRAADVVAALLMVLALATLDIGRAVLAADRRRSSAVAAWWHGLRLLARRPLGLLGGYLLITVAGLLAVALLGLARIHLPHVETPGFVAALLLTQLIGLLLAWMRAARLFALIRMMVPVAGIIHKT